MFRGGNGPQNFVTVVSWNGEIDGRCVDRNVFNKNCILPSDNGIF